MRGMKKILSGVLAAALVCPVMALGPGKDVKLKPVKPESDDKTRIYLDFENVTGGKVPNLQNAKQSGLVSGNIRSVPGLFGKALQTEGDAFVSLPGSALKGSYPALTVEFLLQSGDADKTVTLLDAAGSGGKSAWKLTLLPEKQNRALVWDFSGPNGEQNRIVTNRGVAEKGQWSRVSLVYGSFPGEGGVKGYRVYIDGYVAAELPLAMSINDSAETVKIKSPPGGAVDELAVSFDGREIYPVFDENRLEPRNLGFEEKDKGWLGVYDDPVIDSAVKHSGNFSLLIKTDSVYTREYLSPIFSVEENTKYRISFWAKVDSFEEGNAAFGVWIRWYFAPEETCSFGGDLVANCVRKDFKGPFDWKKFEAELSVPKDLKRRDKIGWARLQVKNYHSKTTVWIDDISVEKIQGSAKKGKN
jgi:hypothetical protein